MPQRKDPHEGSLTELQGLGSPVGRAAGVWTWDSSLAPDNPSLISSMLGMLSQWCLCWRDWIVRPLLVGKKIQSCLIHMSGCTRSIIHEDNKSLQAMQVKITYRCRMLTEIDEGFRNLITDVPSLPCSLSFTTKGRHNITSIKCMEVEHSPCFLRPDWRDYHMDWNPSDNGSLAEGNPHVFKTKFLQGWQNRHCYDKDVCAISLDGEGLAAICCSILGMCKYSCVCLFMIAWRHTIERLCCVANGILSFCHNERAVCL